MSVPVPAGGIAHKALTPATAVAISVSYALFAQTDLVVIYGAKTDTNVLVLDTDYTVALNTTDFSDFTLTPLAAMRTKIDAMIAADATETDQIVIRRSMAMSTDMTATLARFRNSIADEFDRTAMRLQEVDEVLSRTLQTARTDVSGDSTILPDVAAGLGIKRNATGDGWISTTLDPDAAQAAAQVAQAASEAAQTLAETAQAASEAAQTLAETAQAAAEVAKTDAEAAAAAAIAATGSVKVSANDTTPGDLETKLTAGAGVSMTTTSDGGDERRVLASIAHTVSNTWSELQNFADNILQRVVLKDYGETLNDIGSTGGGTQVIDLEAGNFVTLTVDTSANTFEFSSPHTSGVACGFTLEMTNGGSQTITWPATVNWPGDVVPTFTAAGKDTLVFYTLDGGTTWRGFLIGTDI